MTRKSTWAQWIIFCICCAALLPIINTPFESDSFRLMTAFKTPACSNLDFWIKIFTSQMTNGPQYRPISYFATFYIMRMIGGASIFPFHIIAVGLVYLATFQVFNLVQMLTKKFYLALLACTLFLMHPALLGNIYHTAFITKYFIPLNVLLYMFKYSLRDEKLSTLKYLLLCALTALSIGCHEGAILFPLIFMFKHTRYLRSCIVYLPSVIYLIARVFIWHVPDTGFMKVSLAAIPKGLITYFSLSYFWRPFYIFDAPDTMPSYILITGVLTIVSLTIISLIGFVGRIKLKEYLYLFFAQIIAILPFTVLANHTGMNRSIWIIPLSVITIAIVLSKISSNWIRNIIASIVLIFGSINYLQYRSILSDKITSINAVQKDFIDEIKSNTTSRNINLRYNPTRRWRDQEIIPGFLALHFPSYQFTIDSESLVNTKYDKIIVRKGTYLSRNKENGEYVDPYGNIVQNVPDTISGQTYYISKTELKLLL